MWSSRQRKESVRLFGRRVMLVCLLIVLLFATMSVWKTYRKERESSVLKFQAQAQLAELSEREKQLQGEIERLKTDRGKEEALRAQYALAASGEHLIVIVDPPKAEPVATTTFMQKLKNALRWW